LKPFVIGLVLAGVVLAAGFLVPALLPASVSASTLQALRQAELARRQLHVYNASIPLAASQADLEQLKEADFEALVERWQDRFAALAEEFGRRVTQVKRSDQRRGMPESDVRPVAANPAAVRSSVGQFEQALRGNQKLLSEAAANARAATQADREAIGVWHIAGTVKLVEAEGLLAEGRQLRARLADEETRALAKAAEWAAARAERDRHAGMDVAAIRSGLDADLEEIQAALEAARAAVAELTTKVAETEAALAAVRKGLDAARAERLTLEETGFTVGSDESFATYRERYARVAQRLRELQDQEQLLAHGGNQGGVVADDDLLEGAIEGGETVIGLDELQRRLAIAREKLARYERAQQAIEDKRRLVTALGSEAQAQAAGSTARLQALGAQLEQMRQNMAALAQQAFEKEDGALKAAREAAAAFKSAGGAVNKWISDAATLQREKDEQRANERLKQIVGDGFARPFAANAEAQAKTLAGRILTERAVALGAYLDTLRRIRNLVPEATFDAAPLEQQLTTARDEAVNVLGEARDAYEKLASVQSNTSWVHQSALATVYHLLWQVDTFSPEQHRSNLVETLRKVVQDRRAATYLRDQVALLDELGEAGPAQPAPEAPVEPSTGAPPQAEEEEGE